LRILWSFQSFFWSLGSTRTMPRVAEMPQTQAKTMPSPTRFSGTSIKNVVMETKPTQLLDNRQGKRRASHKVVPIFRRRERRQRQEDDNDVGRTLVTYLLRHEAILTMMCVGPPRRLDREFIQSRTLYGCCVHCISFCERTTEKVNQSLITLHCADIRNRSVAAFHCARQC